MAGPLDISRTLIAKSDQLNADDLFGGPITVTITDVSVSESTEQPVIVHISDGYHPFKPCKTVRRILAKAWGPDARAWIGQRMTLYRDPRVKWAGELAGGIRVSALSGIPSTMNVSMAEAKITKTAKKFEYVIEVLPSIPTRRPANEPYTLATWKQALTAAGHDPEKVVAWLGTVGADVAAFIQEEYVAVLADLAPNGSARASYDAYLAR